MNDPHVVSLTYKMSHIGNVDYSKARPLTADDPAGRFTAEVTQDTVVFRLHEHFATEQEARDLIDPIADAWSISAGLRGWPGEFDLEYNWAQIVDRSLPPSTSVFCIPPCRSILTTYAPTFVVTRNLPGLPEKFVASDPIRWMYDRYRAHREKKETVGAVSYYCLTVLEGFFGAEPEDQTRQRRPSKRRVHAAQKLKVDVEVLKKLGDLSSEHGGSTARKWIGRDKPYTPQEREWLDACIRMLIRRAGEVEPVGDPAELPQITMADLPGLE